MKKIIILLLISFSIKSVEQITSSDEVVAKNMSLISRIGVGCPSLGCPSGSACPMFSSLHTYFICPVQSVLQSIINQLNHLKTNQFTHIKSKQIIDKIDKLVFNTANLQKKNDELESKLAKLQNEIHLIKQMLQPGS